jgi:hypothetical protein
VIDGRGDYADAGSEERISKFGNASMHYSLRLDENADAFDNDKFFSGKDTSTRESDRVRMKLFFSPLVQLRERPIRRPS